MLSILRFCQISHINQGIHYTGWLCREILWEYNSLNNIQWIIILPCNLPALEERHSSNINQCSTKHTAVDTLWAVRRKLHFKLVVWHRASRLVGLGRLRTLGAWEYLPHCNKSIVFNWRHFMKCFIVIVVVTFHCNETHIVIGEQLKWA